MSTLDNATWQALGLVLTLLGLGISVLVWRRRGPASGLRALACSLLPLAAGLTGTLALLWRIGDAIVSWAVRLVFSPVVWLGVVVACIAVVLYVVSRILAARGLGGPGNPGSPGSPGKPVSRGSGRPAVSGADDIDDIEAILRKHNIS